MSSRSGRVLRGWCVLALALLAVTAANAAAATRTWRGVSGDWFDASNWTGGVPGAGDSAIVNAGTVLLTNETDALAALTVNGGSIVFSNWTTALRAEEVAIYGGSLTLPPAFTNSQASNRVLVVCSNLVVGSGGRINADSRGYRGVVGGIGSGPGGGDTRAGGGYGGVGGGLPGLAGQAYGSAMAPEAPGSAGGGAGTTAGKSGGGAVRIAASGAVVVNGSISANGEDSAVNNSGAGSGGGIYITCRTIAGTNGAFSAIGGDGETSPDAGGGGGRISVVYDPLTQSNMPVPSIRFSASVDKAQVTDQSGFIGTLHFPDAQFVTETVAYMAGVLVIPSFDRWSGQSLTIRNSWISLGATNGFTLNVAHDLTIVCDDMTATFARLEVSNGVIEVGGNVTLTNAADNRDDRVGLSLFAGRTNSLADRYGALLRVGGSLQVASNCWIDPYAHPLNGAVVKMVAGRVHVAAGGEINASTTDSDRDRHAVMKGFGPNRGPGTGTADRKGGGYGGMGGGIGGGPTYGSSNAPVQPGSGGKGTAARGGGGLVWIESLGLVQVDGSITANGTAAANSPGGSGGAIYIRCHTFAGNGAFEANGGTGATTPDTGGGGGRIAVARVKDYSALWATNSLGGTIGGSNGTVVFIQLPALRGALLQIR